MKKSQRSIIDPREFTNSVIPKVDVVKKHRRKEIEIGVISQGENLEAIRLFLFQNRGCGTYA